LTHLVPKKVTWTCSWLTDA